MSIKIMNMVFERYAGSGNEMVLALAIADYANDEGKGIYPALATLARKSRQSESSARRQIRAMLENGWLIRINSGTGGRGVTTEYQINPEWIKGVNLTPFHVERSEGAEGGEKRVGDPQSEGSPSAENPSTTVTGYPDEKPSNLTPFPAENPLTSTGYSAKRVSNQAEKGVTAMTPDPSEPRISDARAQARRGARATPEPKPPPDPAEQRAFWASIVVQCFLDEIWLVAFEFARQPLAKLPGRLREVVDLRAPPIIDRYATLERSRENIALMTSDVRRAAEGPLGSYRESRAA